MLWYRKKLDITQEDLAEKVDSHQSIISMLENGHEKVANEALLQRIQQVLKFPGKAEALLDEYGTAKEA